MDDRIGTVLQRIPGYAGYRDKEQRRDDDKRIRGVIADALGNHIDSLTRRNAALVEQRELLSISRIERLIGQIRLLGDRVHNATYGYGGIFTENAVDENVLDQLRLFDLTFQREMDELSMIVAKVSSSTASPVDADLEALQAEVARLGVLFDARSQVVDTARPHKDAEVLSLLETNPPPAPSPLLSVGLGDTFSVLGDNYQTDAIVTLADGDIRIQLSRVGENERGLATWFLASTTPEIPTSVLSELEHGGGQDLQMKSAAANVQSAKGKREGISAQYAYSESGETSGEIRFTYIIGDESRHLAGRNVNDVDITVFGAV